MTRCKTQIFVSCSHLLYFRCAEAGDCCCDYQDTCLLDQTPDDTDIPGTTTDSIEFSLCRDAGSCLGRCGGGSDEDCWCDELCHQHGDCCCDMEATCQAGGEDKDFHSDPTVQQTCSEAGSCAGRCDDGSDEDCWCDDHCHHLGDCCCDRLAFCPQQNLPTTPADVLFTIDNTTVTPSLEMSTITTGMPTTVSESDENFTSSECLCSTNQEGPVKGACCIFPFLYKAESHFSCVEVEDGRAWCSTGLDSQGEFIAGHWGYCGENCFWETPAPPSAEGKV